MHSFRILFFQELRQLVFSPATHVAALIFSILTAIFYWSILEGYTLSPQKDLPGFAFFHFFWFFSFFIVPLLTMRSIAEERRSGTLETLLTTPTSAASLIAAKFSATYLVYLGFWILTLGFPLLAIRSTTLRSSTDILLDPSAITGGLAFIALSGTLFISIGIFASSLTRSQLVAAMLTVITLFAVIVGGRLLSTVAFSWSSQYPFLDSAVEYLQVYEHLIDFCRGIFDTRPVVYYLSNTGLLLGLSTLVVRHKA
ncbi:MAG: ABC transporter permease [Puniceicoccaceae bacterium]